MMYLIKKDNIPYPPLSRTKSKETLDFPDSFVSIFYPTNKRAAGFVDIEHDETTVTSCTWNESAYQEWLAQHPDPAEALAAEVREQRDQLLKDSDWTQMPDSPLSESEKEAWKEYRQELRDVPQQEGFPENVTWPDAPA